MLALLALLFFLLAILALIFAIREFLRARLISASGCVSIDEISESSFYCLKASLSCDEPITLPGWDTPCVYYHCVVEEPVSVSRKSAGADFSTTGRWRIAFSKTERCSFQLRGDKQSVSVDPVGATIFGEETPTDIRGSQLLASALMEREAQGLRTRVQIIKNSCDVWLAGYVTKTGEDFCLKAGGPIFIISRRDLNIVGQEMKTASLLSFAASMACLLIGLLSLSGV